MFLPLGHLLVFAKVERAHVDIAAHTEHVSEIGKDSQDKVAIDYSSGLRKNSSGSPGEPAALAAASDRVPPPGILRISGGGDCPHDHEGQENVCQGTDVNSFMPARRAKHLWHMRKFKEIFAGSQHLSVAFRRSGNRFVEDPLEAYPGGRYFQDGGLLRDEVYERLKGDARQARNAH